MLIQHGRSCCKWYFSISIFRMNEVRNWVNTLRPSGGCNLLGALRQLVKWRHIDSVVIILGSRYITKATRVHGKKLSRAQG